MAPSPPSSSPSFICWAWHHMVWNIPLVSWGQLSQLCPLPKLLVHPQPAHWWGGVRAEKALALCKHCSAITKTSLCYQHCFSTTPKHSPILATMKKINSIPAKPAHSCTNVRKHFSTCQHKPPTAKQQGIRGYCSKVCLTATSPSDTGRASSRWCWCIQAPSSTGQAIPWAKAAPKHAAAAAESQCCCYHGDSQREIMHTRVSLYVCVWGGASRKGKLGRTSGTSIFGPILHAGWPLFCFTQSCCNSPSHKCVMATIPTVALYKRSSIFWLCYCICLALCQTS